MLYADYNGSAPIADCVKELLQTKLEEAQYANPNAVHALGQNLYHEQEVARSECAKNMGAKSKQLIFNSGSTEGISHVFNSLLIDASKRGKKTILISSIEHAAVINNAIYYAGLFNLEVITINTLANGLADLKDLESKINQETALVAIMAANNETGVIQPYREISEICQKEKIPYVCDTTQIIGKEEFNFNESGIDYAFLSSHKIGGLIGSGFLVAKDPTLLKPFIIGGSQEGNYRGGTQNYIGVATLACAFKSAIEKMPLQSELRAARLEFEQKLKERYPKLIIFGEEAPRLASTSFLSLPGTTGRKVQAGLEKAGVLVTTSSACCDQTSTISKILQAMNVEERDGIGAIRISIGHHNPKKDYQKIYDSLCKIYDQSE